MPDFLLEIGVEEIPARMLDTARQEFQQRINDLLVRERLLPTANGAVQPTSIHAFSTPRRLAVLVQSIAAKQSDVEEQLTGPSVKIAYKDGVPTPVAEAFAKKAGTDVSKLEKLTTAKGEYVSAKVSKPGRFAKELLAELLPKEIAALNWPKTMYWRGKSSERFIRPIRWITALLDGDIVPLEFAGIAASANTFGHRVLAKGAVKLSRPAEYKGKLATANVLVDATEREHKIRKALDAATRAVPGARWREDKDLLATVVNLTEYPSVILGNFDSEYLSLPEEVLVTVMRDHQKYFAVEDAGGKLAPHFLAVLNTDGDADGLIRHGNERVLRARFNDARFFWQADQKISLKERVEGLKHVTFQKDLGSYYEKAERTSLLVDNLAADAEQGGAKINRDALHESAWLAKADLSTELVKEFTELQGLVGGLYARAQGLSAAVSDAIYDHYKPESMEDGVPRTIESGLLSVADKADTIAGMFALGLQPTGSKDPFALRRQANGIIKIISEHKLPLDMGVLFDLALKSYNGSDAHKKFAALSDYSNSIAAFLRERLSFYLREVHGFAYDEVNATLAAGSNDVLDLLERTRAVAGVRGSADFASISIAFKRIKNILRQAREANKPVASKFDASGLREAEEIALASMIERIAPVVAKLRESRNYSAALTEIAKLRPALDAFFDKVMVMVDDERLRANRLALLKKILDDFSTIADFSEMVTEKK